MEKLHELGAPWLTDKPLDVNASLVVGLLCTYLFKYSLRSLTICNLYKHVICEMNNE